MNNHEKIAADDKWGYNLNLCQNGSKTAGGF